MANIRKPELLAPAGNFTKLKIAFQYGADAVYLGGQSFGLRAKADNFTMDELKEAVALANSLGKKIYVTANIISRDADLAPMAEYVKELEAIGVHGVIVADIGSFFMVKEAAPNLPIHVSTQANNLNSKTIEFWLKNGAVRVNLARELSFDEIMTINQKLLEDMPELAETDEPYMEAFVHGAMCMSFSGRCMLSDYLSNRSSNRGDCAQPCRWNYYVSEEKRPGEYMPVYENERGTFIFNSKDLCMLEHLPRFMECGIGSLKIEGRMKSEFYTATVVNAYRRAIDACWDDPYGYANNKELINELMGELTAVSHRAYSTGFYFGGYGEEIFTSSSYDKDTVFLGVIETSEKAGDKYRTSIFLRGAFNEGEDAEILTPHNGIIRLKLSNMTNDKDEHIERAASAMMKVTFDTDVEIEKGSMLRMRK